MTALEFQTVEDLYVAVRQIRDRLVQSGELEAAEELQTVIKTFWATASEAVGETKVSLLKVRPTVEKIDQDTLFLLDRAVGGATKLFNGG